MTKYPFVQDNQVCTGNGIIIEKPTILWCNDKLVAWGSFERMDNKYVFQKRNKTKHKYNLEILTGTPEEQVKYLKEIMDTHTRKVVN
jgi:hypothetical protein